MKKEERWKSNKNPRAKIGNEKYYKGRYHLAFYEDSPNGEDEIYYAGFNNVVEICKYKKMEINPTNIKIIYQNLYKALKDGQEKHYTKIIDDKKLCVYLIDMIDEIRENERREKFMKEFVQIHSEISIEVYPDLSAIDTTNKAAHIADQFAAKPNWVHPILISKGLHYYPSEIKNWKSVKALARKKLISVSEEVNEVPEAEQAKCAEMKKTISKIANRSTEKKKSEKVESVGTTTE